MHATHILRHLFSALSLASALVGGTPSAAGNKEQAKAKQEDDRDQYNNYVAQYNNAKTDLEENLHPADSAGMIAGYVTGGVLTLTGITLLLVHGIKKNKERPRVAAPTFGGLLVQF